MLGTDVKRQREELRSNVARNSAIGYVAVNLGGEAISEEHMCLDSETVGDVSKESSVSLLCVNLRCTRNEYANIVTTSLLMNYH